MGTKWELSPRDTQFANKELPRAPVDLLPSPPGGQLHEADPPQKLGQEGAPHHPLALSQS